MINMMSLLLYQSLVLQLEFITDLENTLYEKTKYNQAKLKDKKTGARMQGTASRQGMHAVVGSGRQKGMHIQNCIKKNKQLFSFSEMAEISQKEF